MSLKTLIGREHGYVSKDGLCEDFRDGGFVKIYDKICGKHERDKQEWVKRLRELGIKGSHPNDGWHEREKHYFQFSYPHFNDGIEVGDMVALGTYEKFRVFVVTKIQKSWNKKYYYA